MAATLLASIKKSNCMKKAKKKNVVIVKTKHSDASEDLLYGKPTEKQKIKYTKQANKV